MATAPRKNATKGNKPGEPTFKLQLDVKEVKLPWEKDRGSSYTDVKITNPFSEPHTFKVKYTDRKIFRCRPPMGSIEPKQSVTIRVIQHAHERPSPEAHCIGIFHKKCTADDVKKNEWKLLWAKDRNTEGITRLPVAFVEPVHGYAPSVTPSAPSSTARK